MGNTYFLILLILALLCFYIADNRNNKLILIIGIITISIISGLRGVSVGCDTASYYNAIIKHFPIEWQYDEIGFRFISNNLMYFFNDAKYVMMTFSLIINSLIVLRLWDYRKKCNFTFMTLLYILIYFIDSMNITRQFIALAMVFYSTRFLEKKRYIIFILIVLLATSIHKTSILALFLIFVYGWNKILPRRRILYAIPVILLLAFSLNYIIMYESDHIGNYLSASNAINNINITYIYRVFIFVLSYFLIRKNKIVTFKKHVNFNSEELMEPCKMDNDFKIFAIFYFFGLFLSSMGMFYSLMQRIGYVYLIFELLYWGYLVKKSKNKGLSAFMIVIYAIYIFSLEIIRNGSCVFPYVFNF